MRYYRLNNLFLTTVMSLSLNSLANLDKNFSNSLANLDKNFSEGNETYFIRGSEEETLQKKKEYYEKEEIVEGVRVIGFSDHSNIPLAKLVSVWSKPLRPTHYKPENIEIASEKKIILKQKNRWGFMAQKEFILCPKVVNFIANLKNEAKYDGSLVYFDLYCLRHFQKLEKSQEQGL